MASACASGRFGAAAPSGKTIAAIWTSVDSDYCIFAARAGAEIELSRALSRLEGLAWA